jgi:hypothetical protein
VFIIVGSIVGVLVVLGFLGNIGSGGDTATPTASILTKTVTVTAPPPISTVTVVAAPPVPRPAPTSYPPIEEPPPLPPVGLLMPPIPSSAYYGSCAAARAAGAAPLHVGKPGYRPALDPDGDGIAC